jgi:hypothetical protein
MSVLPAYRAGSPGALSAIDADAAAWRDAVVTNGGSVSAGRLSLVGILIAALKAGGSWSLDDDIWMLVAENSIQALTSIKQRRLGVAVNSPTFTADLGYAFDGSTNYIDTGFIFSTHGVAAAANNNRIAGYERTNVSANSYLAGTSSGTNRIVTLRPRTTGTTSVIANNSATANFTLPASDSRGYLAGSRNTSDATGIVAYKNGAAITRTADPSGYGASLPSHNLYIGAFNNTGTAATFRASTIGAVAVGAALTAGQELAEYTAVQAHMTALGAQV